MLYRAKQSGCFTVGDREVELTRGERVSSNEHLPEDIKVMVARGWIIPEEDVEAATAAPGEKRSTRRA